MSDVPGDRSVELEALERLDLLSTAREAPEGGSLLDALVELKKLAPHQARAVRALIERNAVKCQCGLRQLAPESTSDRFTCRACGTSLAREAAPLTPVQRAAAAARMPGVGSRVGPLELLQVLGKGAYGVVFRARNHSVGRESAVKVIPSGLLDMRVRKRFEREVEALARLRHPAIVAVHATHEVEGALALEMELVDGEDLEAKIRRGPLPWREAVKLVHALALGVAHAHKAGVLHRDLKPANVLVRRSDGAPQIADFGLARFDDKTSSLTRAGAYVGTPLYMAPEAFGGKTGPATDIYGLGAILVQTVTGHAPFNASTPEELMVEITRGRCAPIALADAPADLERLRARAMAPDPAKRYPDADALADDLARLLDGQPILARQGARLRSLVVSLAVGAVVVMAAVGIALSRRGGHAPPPASPEPGRTLVTAEDALAVLVAGERDGERRAAALRLLSSPAARPSAAALDSAVLAAPGDGELRRIRALTCWREKRPIEARDLFEATGPVELEGLIGAALSAGVRGDPRDALATVSELRARKDSRALDVLAGILECATGDATARERIVKALEAGHGVYEPARRLLAVMRRADAVAESLGRDEPRAADLAESLANESASIARETPLAPRVILEPVARAECTAWKAGAITDLIRPVARRVLGRFQELPARSMPPIIAILGAMVADIHVDPSDFRVWPGTAAELAAASNELRNIEPILAGVGYDIAASRALEQDAFEDARRYVTLAIQEAGKVDGTTRPGGEVVLAKAIRRRVFVTQGLLEERLVTEAATKDPEAARAAMERAIASWRRVAAVDEEEDVPPSAKERDTVHLARMLLRAGRGDEAVEAMLDGADREALRAEVLRRKGEPARALEVVKVAMSSRPTAACWAVHALVAFDLGDRAEARKSLANLEELERTTPPFLDELRSSVIGPRIDR